MFIYVLTGLTRTASVQRVLPAVLDGRISSACALAEGMLESQSGADAAEMALLCADLMLAQDRDEQAEDLYRRAVKAATTSARGQVRVIATRNTGFLGLYQQRFGTAAACFKRVAEDAVASVAQQVEALGGLAIARYALGQPNEAMCALDQADRLIDEKGAGAAGGTVENFANPLSTFVFLLRAELLVQIEVRSHSAFGDHVYWRAAEGLQANAGNDLLAVLAASRKTHGTTVLTRDIVGHLHTLVMAARGDASSLRSLNEQLAKMDLARMVTAERLCRVEVALVAVSARNVEMAQHVLESLQAMDERWYRRSFEVAYCLAKISELTGRASESLMHYRRYAHEFVQRLRRETAASPSPQRSDAAASPAKDEVEMSLPAKYRRAYRYLVNHLYSSVLSVREIAEHVGVTERSLQSTFRSHLGLTPMELIQRCRMERIRNDLLHGEFTGSMVIDTAARWGISNRSTLLACYRKYFSESPADTLARRDSDDMTPHYERGGFQQIEFAG